MSLSVGLCNARRWATKTEDRKQDAQKFLEPAQEQVEAVACGGEHGVNAVAIAALGRVRVGRGRSSLPTSM